MTELFDLLKACLFTNAPVYLSDWRSTFTEMKDQAVAALPGEWLKAHPVDPEWSRYCSLEKGQWVRVMHAQSQLISLLEENHIPSVIIKGSAAAMYYPHPALRSMGDVDVLVKREDHERSAELLEANGYILTQDKRHVGHHYNFSKESISIELHKRLPVIDDADEEMLTFFEDGINQREWIITEGYKFPVFPPLLNGLVLIFHINQHLREGLGLRQIVDWMMYVNSLTIAQWNELGSMLQSVGMEKLALTTTAMCQKYLGLKKTLSGCETVDPLVCDELMAFILEKGNFGRKAGVDGKVAAFSLFSTERGGFFHRLQVGGLGQWKAAKKYPILRPFAWIYQAGRIMGIFIKSKTGLKELIEQKENGVEQRKLIEALGLNLDRTINTE